MIAFFRSILESKLVMGLFALIMLAFVITGVGTGSGGIGNLAAGSLLIPDDLNGEIYRVGR